MQEVMGPAGSHSYLLERKDMDTQFSLIEYNGKVDIDNFMTFNARFLGKCTINS
jgi:hypothetical protein